jgi:adenine/guanine phosphoribosyltransferase-like PRPP-binding protein
MKNKVLIIGEDTLLKLKLVSVLSRSKRVLSVHTEIEAMRVLVDTEIGYCIFCDRFFTDIQADYPIPEQSRLICLASHDRSNSHCETPKSPSVMQIMYDTIYGFSSYSTKVTSRIPLPQLEQQTVYPTLVDDIAYWLSQNLDKSGLFYLRGSELISRAEFNDAIASQEPRYALLQPNQQEKQYGAESTVLMKHTLQEGVEIVRRQRICAVNLIYKLPLHTEIAGMTIGKIRGQMGELAAKQLPTDLIDQLDYIVPVPNSGIAYAHGVARSTNLPCREVITKREKIRSFHLENAEDRESLIRSTMTLDPNLIYGANICLVDEAIFTGMTLKILCHMLRETGANKIHVLIPSPPCTSQCPYCSIPTRQMLLETVSRDLLAQEIGADSVTFQRKSTFEHILEMTGMTLQRVFF